MRRQTPPCRRLIAAGASGVTCKVKDYRVEGPGRYKTMTLATGELIQRFLTHVLPKGLHGIRHYGLFANDGRDTRAVQHYLGHKNIMHTVRYTELSPERFKIFWQDSSGR